MTPPSSALPPQKRPPRLYAEVMICVVLGLGVQGVGLMVALAHISRTDRVSVTTLILVFVASAALNLAIAAVFLHRVLRVVDQVSAAAASLANGPLRGLAAALQALGRGELDTARMAQSASSLPIDRSRELGAMAQSFNLMAREVDHAARGLDQAREGVAHARAELTAARDSAQTGERSKAEFLAVISHELRTPLNGVIGLAGLLLDGTLDAQSRLYAKMLHEAGDHLLDLINDLLDVTKLEADHLAFDHIPFDLDSLVQSALDMVAPRAHVKKLEFGAYVPPDIPPVLKGDPGRLRQVLINLLGNAVKFTSVGNVTLEVAMLAQNADMVTLDFAISDTGIGIRPEDLPQLFEVFAQVDQSVSRRFGGSGLGLVISERLAVRMGGHISVDSKLGDGSVFHFVVPLKLGAAAPGQTPRGTARLAGEKILLLHSNETGTQLLTRKIVSRGGRVERTVVAGRALDLLRQACARGAPFDAVLVDHALIADGATDFARRLRADPTIATTRVVLISTSEFANTGAAPAGTRAETPAAPLFNAKLLRPVPVDTLIYRLQGEAAGNPAGPNGLDEHDQTATRPPGPALRILVAEDNHTNQTVIRAMLAKLGHRADLVADGNEALGAIAARPYDVVLMDVMMPELDGLAATSLIRALPQPAGQVPVIGLTADALADHHHAYRSAGMQSVLIKPVTLAALQSALAAVTRPKGPPDPQDSVH